MPSNIILYGAEAESVLRKFNLYDDVVSGKARCHVCGKQLSLSNVGMITEVGGKQVITCSSYACLLDVVMLNYEVLELRECYKRCVSDRCLSSAGSKLPQEVATRWVSECKISCSMDCMLAVAVLLLLFTPVALNR